MPIRVQYQPPMELLARAGFTAGAGQFAQRQQELNRRDQQDAIAAAQRQQALDIQRGNQYLDYQQAMEAQELRRAALEQQAAQRQQQFELGQQRLDLGRERNQAYIQQLQQSDPQVRQQLQFENASAAALDKQATTFQAAMSKLPLNEMGKQKFAELQGLYRSIQQQRHEMRPQAYAQAMGEYFKRVGESGVEQMLEPPPTPEQMFEKSVYHDPATGNWVLYDSKGNPRPYDPKPKESAKDKEPARFNPQTGKPLSADEYYAQLPHSKFSAVWAKAKSEVTNQKRFDAPPDGKVSEPTPEEIWKVIRFDYEGMYGKPAAGEAEGEAKPEAITEVWTVDPVTLQKVRVK